MKSSKDYKCPNCKAPFSGKVFLCQGCGYCADEKREKYETFAATWKSPIRFILKKVAR